LDKRDYRTNSCQNIFEKERWTSAEALVLVFLGLLALVLLGSGLSVRSLWGPEGRWALIIREMVRRGAYCLPTTNGIVDFDKPLLGYWAAIPFAWLGGVNEAAIRLPSVIAGALVVSLVFCLGRRLFGPLRGLLSAALLLSSSLFVFWSRSASAELLNTLAVWLMLWAYVAGGWEGRLRYLLVFYGAGAVGSFVKGPVAPALAISATMLFSLWQAAAQMRRDKERKKAGLIFWFRWLLSRGGLAGAMFGLMLFLGLLLVPVLATGSWTSVSLMWRENIVRFFHPFDHREPAYVYPLYIARFFAPWTLFLVASLWDKRKGPLDWGERWLLLTVFGIFMFFTLSGSRRSYYILPILPGLALISGKAMIDWVHRQETSFNPMVPAAFITTCLMILVGAGLLLLPHRFTEYRNTSELLAGITALAAGIGAFLCFRKRRFGRGLVTLVALVVFLNTWGFTGGMALAEKKRTLIGFAQRVTPYLKGSGYGKVCLYEQGTASLIFYLNSPQPIPECTTTQQCETFRKDAGGSYIIADMNEVKGPDMLAYLDRMARIVEQDTPHDNEERFVLFAFDPGDRKGSEPDRFSAR
jgi:4-amino-4-deoxy-L-arabinose transferase-like glycosyltransferase